MRRLTKQILDLKLDNFVLLFFKTAYDLVEIMIVRWKEWGNLYLNHYSC